VSGPELGEELVRLASADNFRDVTGPDTAYVAVDGTPLRRGVAFRSNELLLTAADAESLARLGITAVYDLRSDHEVEVHPDVPVPGASWTQLEVKGIPMDAVTDLHDRTTAQDVMRQVYRGFVEVEGARQAFGSLLRRIADGEGGALFHCTAGKDRTGWASALLLHLAGVDDETVLEDYLLTNSFSSATREKYLGMVREHLGADKVDVYERVMVADAAYLQEGYDAVAAAYGSRLGYLRDGLGLDDATVARLRDRLRHGPEASRT
jgi:protein-tyrosine phosphatase